MLAIFEYIRLQHKLSNRLKISRFCAIRYVQPTLKQLIGTRRFFIQISWRHRTHLLPKAFIPPGRQQASPGVRDRGATQTGHSVVLERPGDLGQRQVLVLPGHSAFQSKYSLRSVDHHGANFFNLTIESMTLK